MTTIVKTVLAGDLPEHLRQAIDPTHVVRITVTDLGLRQPSESSSEALRIVQQYRDKHSTSSVTSEEAVARVRALRDEWD